MDIYVRQLALHGRRSICGHRKETHLFVQEGFRQFCHFLEAGVSQYLGCNGWVLYTARVAACVVPNAMREPPVAIPMLGLVRAVHRALRKHCP